MPISSPEERSGSTSSTSNPCQEAQLWEQQRASCASPTSCISTSTPAGTFATAAQPIQTSVPPFLKPSLSTELPPSPETTPTSTAQPIPIFSATTIFKQSRTSPPFTSDTS